MGNNRKRALWALPLALAIAATACGSSSKSGTAATTTTAAAASSTTGGSSTGSGGGSLADVNLKGVCPDTVVIQTDWFPEAEHGTLYQMVGDSPTIDASKKLVRGKLMAPGGKDTGVNIEIRTGGPAIGFQTVVSQLKQDPNILLGYVATDEAIENYKDVPTKAVVAPLEINPQIIMWDPATYPDVKTIADLQKKNVTIRYFQTGAYMKYMVNSGQVKQSQLDGSYDGSPAVFTAQGGKIAQQGFASAEPYTYQNLIKEWAKPVSYQLIHDAGWTTYAAPLAVTQDKFEKNKPCFKKLVPIVQQSAVDYSKSPDKANALIVKAVQEYKDFWVYSSDLAKYADDTMKKLGLVGNGPDKTIGNFDEQRLTEFIKKALPVFAAKNPPADLKWSDLVTNEFIDTSIGLS
ncbi:MAG: hypothetical protein QOJ19_1798 [Acidimicrobiia bacterium]|jgi:hypothetical protein|nr:hypothetical protein [Acidimicrobiia bacterium]